MLDISSSSVAGGKIRRAATLGEPIAEGLALDPAGNPTVDPAQAIAGALLPLGAHKGSGLALAISIFVAMLAEAEFDDLVASHYHDRHPQNLGQLFIVIDPSAVVDREQAERRVAGFLERLHGLADDGEGSEIHYPGEGAAEHERIRRRFGIPVAREDIDALASTCEECGLPALAEQTRRLVAEAPTVTSNVQQPEGKTTR